MNIQEQVEKYIASRITEYVEDGSRDKIFVHVSQMVKKYWPAHYKHIRQTDAQKENNFFIGKMLHTLTLSKHMNEWTLAIDAKTLKSVALGKHPDSDTCFAGTLDDVICLEGGINVLLDKKTTSIIPNMIPQHYAMQLNFYNLMLRVHGIVIHKVGIVYFNKDNRFERKVILQNPYPIPYVRNEALDCLKRIKNKEF